MSRRCAVWLMLFLAGIGSARSQEPSQEPPPPSVSWSSLSGEQQRLLENFHGQWESLPPPRQQALSNGASRWAQMTPEQRDGAQQRFRNWQHLPPEQQLLIRQRWQHFQHLPPEQQAVVRQNFRAFSGLPPEQRQLLRQRWLNATPQQRTQMLQNQRDRRMQRGGDTFHPHFRGPPPGPGRR